MKPRLTDAGRVLVRILGLLLLASPRVLVAQSDELSGSSSATEAASFLLIPLGARNIGFGGAMAGSRGDVEGTLWNPASVAGVEDWAVFYHGSNDFGTSTHAVGGVFGAGDMRIGISILNLNLGSIDGRDESNQPTGEIQIDNTLGIITIARSISSVVDIGGSYKFIRIGGSCPGCGGAEPDASGHAFDAAVIVRPPALDGLRIGLVVSNLGPNLGFDADGARSPLPSRIRVGAEADVLRGRDGGRLDLVARADLRQTLSEFDQLDVLAGAELGYAQLAYLRVGFSAGVEGRTGPALGLGIRYEGIMLDIGRSFDDFSDFDTDSPFQVSVSYQP